MILILTGLPVSGKSTVGPLIAHKLEQCAAIDVDVVRTMIIQPHIAPWLGAAGMTQLHLDAQNACLLARNFVVAGYAVVMLDVLADATATLSHAQLADLPHRIVLLLPTLETVLARNQQRGQWLTDDEAQLLYGWEEALTVYDQRIDNTDLWAEQLSAELAQVLQKTHG